MASPLTLGYLDDVTLGGKTQVVADDIEKLEAQCKTLGLLLNRSKCEVISRSPIITQDKHQLNPFSFIHYGHFYSAPSSPLLLRRAPDYSTDTISEFHAEAHRQL